MTLRAIERCIWSRCLGISDMVHGLGVEGDDEDQVQVMK